MFTRKQISKIASRFGLVLDFKAHSPLIEAWVKPQSPALKAVRLVMKEHEKFLSQEDHRIYMDYEYSTEAVHINIPNDGDEMGLGETFLNIAAYFAAPVPKSALRRRAAWEKIPERPILKGWRLLEGGNFPTDDSFVWNHAPEFRGKLVEIRVTVPSGYYKGKYSALVNLGKKPIALKKGYYSTRLRYRCDDLVVQPGQVIVRVGRGNALSFSTYLVGEVSPHFWK